MTTPDTKMLSAEQLDKIRASDLVLHSTTPCKQIAAHIDALTARVAELEREVQFRREAWAGADKRCAELESELAAARAPVGDEEVAAAVRDLTNPAHASSRRNEIAILITSLARERDEARAALRSCYDFIKAEYWSEEAIASDGHPIERGSDN